MSRQLAHRRSDTIPIQSVCKIRKDTVSIIWAEDFIFSGTSAVLLLVVNLFQAYWYFCFLALVPFIYRISRASIISSFRLGFFLGISFFAASAIDSFLVVPFETGLKILSAVAILTLFAGSVGWIRQCFGFNPILIALLWAGFELGLVKLGFIDGLFGEARFSLPFFKGLAAIFGFIIVSTILVFANSLIVLAIEKIVALVKKGALAILLPERGRNLYFPCEVSVENLYLIPESRAPPTSI